MVARHAQPSRSCWHERIALPGNVSAENNESDGRSYPVNSRIVLQSIEKGIDPYAHPANVTLIKSKKRVVDHGEVFTPAWLIEKMLDQVKGETERIDSRFLEPACGNGNFLLPVLQRKLAAVEASYGKNDFDRKNYALLALMSSYGIEILSDNIDECRSRLLSVFSEYLCISNIDMLYRAAIFVLSKNLVHGNALTMRGCDEQPISFCEWGYLGRGKFQRRDFRLDVLAGSSAFNAEDSLFARLGKHELFTPTKSYPPLTVKELANAC